MPSQLLLDTQLDGLSLVRRGKVRDVYAAGDALILVATDRISAFDYVLGSGIPDKGRVLNQLSAFWFGRTGHIIPNHLISTSVADYPAGARARLPAELDGRSMLCTPNDAAARRVRGARLLSGSGWKDYKATGEVCGIPLPKGTARIGSPARADLHAGHEGGIRTRREHQRSRGGQGGRRRSARAPEAPDAGAVRARRGARRIERASSSPTRSSSSG